jgi:hypothetical protein
MMIDSSVNLCAMGAGIELDESNIMKLSTMGKYIWNKF